MNEEQRDDAISRLYARRAPLTRAQRLGKPFDADALQAIETELDRLEMEEEMACWKAPGADVILFARAFELGVEAAIDWLLDDALHSHPSTAIRLREAAAAMRTDLLDVAGPGGPDSMLARLDADKTAEPKTQLRSHIHVGDEGTMFALPGDTHVDLETGKKTPLR